MSEYPSFDLTGQTALVTGAARGLGNSIAKALANAGADIALGLRDVNTGNELAAEIEGMGRRVLKLQMDITKHEQIQSSVDEMVKRFGKIDILVNNAGLGPENAAEDVTEADFDLTVAINLKGTFFVSQAVGRQMIKQKHGKIINLGSQAGHCALPGEAIYCMTKAGVAHLTKCLAVEWGKHNINVNCIAPTFIATPGTEAALSDPAFKAEVEERIAGLHRIGRPVDVCGAIIFLASPASSLITGDTLMIDGGWTAR